MNDLLNDELEQDQFIHEVELEHQKIDKQWLELHFNTILWIIIIGFFVESVLANLWYKIDIANIQMEHNEYLLYYVLQPFLLNFGWMLLAILTMTFRNISDRIRVYLLSIVMIGICTVFYYMHNNFNINLLFFAPILFTVFYGEYRLTTFVSFFSFTMKFICDAAIHWQRTQTWIFASGFAVMHAIIPIIIAVFFYMIMMVIIFFQKKKNDAVIQKEIERQQLQRQLLMDPLTGINNRIALRSMFQKIEEATDADHYIFAMMDLDNFKALNDTFGHKTGDTCLELVGMTLDKYRSTSLVPFRFGGDEFCILFKGKTVEQVKIICEDIRKELKESIQQTLAVSMTISIGIAEYIPNMFAEDLLNLADSALYRAKSIKDTLFIHES